MNALVDFIAQQNRRILVAFNVCFFAYLFYWLYHNIDLTELMRNLQEIPPLAVLTAMGMNVLVLLFFAFRLSAILTANAVSCLILTTMGFTFNSLMPFRAGEGVKIYFGHSSYAFPLGRLSAAVLIEKLYDACAVILLATLVGALSRSQIANFGALPAVVLALLIAIGAIAMRLKRRGALRSPSNWRIVKAVRLETFVKQAETLVSDHSVARPLLFTALIWTTNVCLVFVAFRTLVPAANVDIISAMTLQLIAALAIAVPASPAGLGIFEAGIVSYLITVYGVQKEQALSTALAYHFAITAPHMLIVLAFLGLTLFRLVRAKLRPSNF